jgi:hypothetical protein
VIRGGAGLVGALLLFPLGVSPAQNPPQRTAKIVGIVLDSIHRTGLPGADVMVTGVAAPVTTDSLGRFVVENLPSGTYQVGVFHPLLESLGLTLASNPFTLAPDSTVAVSLAIPSVTTLARRYCGTAVTTDKPAVVVGRVLDPDTDLPIKGARVSLAWVDVIISKQTGVVRTPHELHVDSDSTGFFKFCALTEDLDASVQAKLGSVATGEVAVSTHDSPLTFENLAIAAPNPSGAVTGMVRGTVLALDDKPIEGARVEAPMWGVFAVSKRDGSFNLDRIPTGTQLLIIRHVGYEPTRASINVTSRQPIDINVVLGPRVNLLDPVLVTARRNYALERDGFLARQKSGWGTYFTAEDIQKRNPQYISDMLRTVNGISVVHSTGGTVIRDERKIRSSILGGGRSGCVRLWVDGSEWRIVDPGDLDSFVSPSEVTGLEVYRSGSAPAQFRGVEECVVILIWTQMQSQVKQP